MLGGWGPYTLSGFDVQSRSLVPQLKCPVEGRELGPPPIAIEFTNQEFTNRQFANVPSISEHHDWYEVVATVVVDHVTETFGGVWMAPEVSARLVKVISK